MSDYQKETLRRFSEGNVGLGQLNQFQKQPGENSAKENTADQPPDISEVRREIRWIHDALKQQIELIHAELASLRGNLEWLQGMAPDYTPPNPALAPSNFTPPPGSSPPEAAPTKQDVKQAAERKQLTRLMECSAETIHAAIQIAELGKFSFQAGVAIDHVAILTRAIGGLSHAVQVLCASGVLDENAIEVQTKAAQSRGGA